MSHPKLSVIVPVYNVEKYLSKCIESILNQTFIDFELLLINDGSTDNSGVILDEFKAKDTRIRVFHTKNNGVSCARNIGIEEAIGEWVCFVDSDDWIDSKHFENFFISKFRSNTIVYQGINFEYEREQITRPFFQYNDLSLSITNGELIAQYKILHNGCPYCKLFNLHLIKAKHLRFNPEISIHEDHCFVWQYLEHIDNIELRKGSYYHYMKREVETLTSKSHTPKEYLISGENLLTALSKIDKRIDLLNGLYLCQLNDNFGMMQLLEAIAYSTDDELENTIATVKHIVKKFPEFKFKSLKKKLAFSTLLSSPVIFQQLLHSIIRHYKK